MRVIVRVLCLSPLQHQVIAFLEHSPVMEPLQLYTRTSLEKQSMLFYLVCKLWLASLSSIGLGLVALTPENKDICFVKRTAELRDVLCLPPNSCQSPPCTSESLALHFSLKHPVGMRFQGMQNCE